MEVSKEKSPSMGLSAEKSAPDFAELRLSEERSAPDSWSVESGGGEKDGAGFLSFMKGLLGNVVKLGSPTSPMPTTLTEPNQMKGLLGNVVKLGSPTSPMLTTLSKPNQTSKEEGREILPSRVRETECKKETKEKQSEKVERKETENEKEEKKETENERVEQKETEKPAQEKGKEATQSGGQKECKFYSMAGGCKYGGSCRFAHHIEKSDVGSVELNFLGLPIRPGKRECPFYMRTGNCKFSTNCKFHHPDPIADSARDSTYGYSNGEAQEQNSSGASQMATTPWPEPRTMNEPIPFQDASPYCIPGMVLPQCDDNGEKNLDMFTVKGEKKNSCKKAKHVRIEQMRVTLGLSDFQRTPTPGETLGNFYRRTKMYWQMTAHKHTQDTGNELRMNGFDLAKARYKQLKPMLDELAIQVADQKAEEKAGAETSSRNKINQVETRSRRKAGTETSSREEVNSAKTSSRKKAGGERSYGEKVKPAGSKF